MMKLLQPKQDSRRRTHAALGKLTLPGGGERLGVLTRSLDLREGTELQYIIRIEVCYSAKVDNAIHLYCCYFSRCLLFMLKIWNVKFSKLNQSLFKG